MFNECKKVVNSEPVCEQATETEILRENYNIYARELANRIDKTSAELRELLILLLDSKPMSEEERKNIQVLIGQLER